MIWTVKIHCCQHYKNILGTTGLKKASHKHVIFHLCKIKALVWEEKMSEVMFKLKDIIGYILNPQDNSKSGMNKSTNT